MITAWVLIVWAGSRGGYYSVPNISTPTACEQLYQEIRANGFYENALIGKDHLCLQYPVNRKD